MAGGFAVGGPGGAAAGSIGGSAAGAAVGKGLRNAVGHALGVNDASYTEGTGQAAALAGATDALTLGAVGTGKYIKWLWKGSSPFTDTQAQMLLNEQARQQKLIDNISQGAGMPFQPTAAQTAMGPNSQIRASMAAGKARAATIAAKGSEEGAALVATKQAQNEQAIKNYFDNLLANHQLSNIDPQAAAQNVSKGLLDPYDRAAQLAKQTVAQLPPNVPEEQTSKILRGALEAARDNYKMTVETPAWNAYRKAIGFDPQTFSSNIQIPWSDRVKDLMQSWTAQERKALIGLATKDSTNLKLNIPQPNSEEDTALLKSFGMDAKTDTADLANVDDAIHWLRDASRKRMVGDQGVVLDTKKLNDLKNSLVDMRNSYLEQNSPDIKNALDVAEAATKTKYDRFNRGLADTMLSRDSSGQPRLTDLEALNQLMYSKDRESVRQIADMIKGDPEAKNQLNQFLLAKYRNEAVNPNTGMPTVAGHNRFMKNYGAVLDTFFNKEDLKNIYQMGGMARTIANEYKNLRTFLPRSFTDLQGNVESLNANKLITSLFTDSQSPETLSRAMKNMDKYEYKDNMYEQWRSAAADALYSRIVRNGQFDPDSLGRLIENNNGQQMKMLEKLFNTDGQRGGTQLVKGLKTLQEASQLIRDPSMTAPAPDQTTIFSRAARAFLGPFSEEGRWITFFKQQRVKENPVMIYQLLTDPSALREYTQQTAKTMNKIKAANAISLGADLGQLNDAKR
jgi:hypothetical protein